MVRLIAGFLFFLGATHLNAQNNISRIGPPPISPQQFQQESESIQNPDSLVEYISFYAFQNVRRRPQIATQALQQIKDIQDADPRLKSAHKSLIQAYLFRIPDPDSALFYANSSIKSFKEIDKHEEVVNTMVYVGELYSRTNRYLEAEEIYMDALEYFRMNDIEGIPESHLQEMLTNLYMRVGAIDIALKYYQERLDSETSPLRICELKLKMSNAYRRNNELGEARRYLNECKDIDNIPVVLKGAIIRGLSEIEKVEGNIEGQIRNLEQASKFQTDNPQTGFVTNILLGNAYLEQGNLKKLDSVITELNSLNFRRQQPPSRVQYHLLRAELQLSNSEVEDALETVERAIQEASRMPQNMLQVDALILKAKILEEKGNYQSAYSITKTINDERDLLVERGRIYEESMGKVRLQMRAKNQELADVATELGTVKTRNAVIVCLLLLGAFYALYRYRVHFLLQEEKTRNKIARDLHDDLSGTLSSISFFSEAAKRAGSASEEPGKFLQKIDESAVEAKEKINDIIWAIDPENDDWQYFLTKCKRYASDMFESKGIAYQIDVDTKNEISIEIEARKDLWLIYKEIITNLVRHSKASNARIAFKSNKNSLKLSIEDDGIGFEVDETHQGNGLKNIKKRVSSISRKCTFSLNSTLGKGTKWELRFDGR